MYISVYSYIIKVNIAMLNMKELKLNDGFELEICRMLVNSEEKNPKEEWPEYSLRI